MAWAANRSTTVKKAVSAMTKVRRPAPPSARGSMRGAVRTWVMAVPEKGGRRRPGRETPPANGEDTGGGDASPQGDASVGAQQVGGEQHGLAGAGVAPPVRGGV